MLHLRLKKFQFRLFSSNNHNLPKDVPSLKEFLRQQPIEVFEKHKDVAKIIHTHTSPLNFHIETYGCQMNSSDSEIVRSILTVAGHKYCNNIQDADLILTNTCAIRENAESKVWHRLNYFQSMRAKNKRIRKHGFPLVGVLGCMAERLKGKLLDEDSVDFVCGPDAYRGKELLIAKPFFICIGISAPSSLSSFNTFKQRRQLLLQCMDQSFSPNAMVDIPRLLEGVLSTGQKEANTMLSFEETYADINPVREGVASTPSVFVSNPFYAVIDSTNKPPSHSDLNNAVKLLSPCSHCPPSRTPHGTGR